MINGVESGNWLQGERLAKGMSQVALGRLLGVSQGTISSWERGRSQPDEVQSENLRRILANQIALAGPEPALNVEGLDTPPTSAGWGDEYPLDAVFVRTDQRTVIDVVRRIRNDRYDLNPEFQRDFVWAIEKQSKLMESCLMRIPLPVLYVAEAMDGRIIVVDGLQRLSTFRRYLDNEFRLSFPKTEDGKAHLLEGKKFKDLDVKLQKRIEDTQLTLYILDSKAPERAKLDIFERVNSGEPLTRQQMRNCLYNGPATRWLKDASKLDLFLKATGESLDSDKMRDREAINRFCAFSILGWRLYKSGDMDSFLAETLDRMNKMSDSDREIMKHKFQNSMFVNLELFGRHAFRKSLTGGQGNDRSVLNIALFDVCSVLLADLDVSSITSRSGIIRSTLDSLLSDQDFVHSITYSTNSRKQVANRFERMEIAFSGVFA